MKTKKRNGTITSRLIKRFDTTSSAGNMAISMKQCSGLVKDTDGVSKPYYSVYYKKSTDKSYKAIVGGQVFTFTKNGVWTGTRDVGSVQKDKKYNFRVCKYIGWQKKSKINIDWVVS